MSQKAPIVQTTAKVAVRHTQAGDSQGTTRAMARGAVPAASARKRTDSTVNMTSVVDEGRLPANSFRSIQRIWPMKKIELRSVSHSPLPNRKVRQSKCPRTPTPRRTSAHPAQMTAPGLRRLLKASHTGMRIA